MENVIDIKDDEDTYIYLFRVDTISSSLQNIILINYKDNSRH